MDMGLSEDPEESYRIFQSQILEEYDKMTAEFSMSVIDATLPIRKQQSLFRSMVKETLASYRPAPFLRKKENVYVA